MGHLKHIQLFQVDLSYYLEKVTVRRLYDGLPVRYWSSQEIMGCRKQGCCPPKCTLITIFGEQTLELFHRRETIHRCSNWLISLGKNVGCRLTKSSISAEWTTFLKMWGGRPCGRGLTAPVTIILLAREKKMEWQATPWKKAIRCNSSRKLSAKPTLSFSLQL